MNEQAEHQARNATRGYLEGFYGKLLSWEQRNTLLECLSSLELNSYCYAPKEDIFHRLHWREPYDSAWRSSFSQFCKQANKHNVLIAAGIAPGLDFNFDQQGIGSDLDLLYNKATQLITDGAQHVLVLWDDIEETSLSASGGLSEGAMHADVINKLSEKLGRTLWCVPRVYAREIDSHNYYLDAFFNELETEHTVILCGNAIVTGDVSSNDLKDLSRSGVSHSQLNTLTGDDDSNGSGGGGGGGGRYHKTILWDNFYANDYCPRRLFVGPWTGRSQIQDYLLNPTGMPFTDQLLLDIAVSTQSSLDVNENWINALARHGVPEAFLSIAPFFSKPFFGDRNISGDGRDIDFIKPSAEVKQAVETCLWNWKSPLAREWYPFIFGLKHDLALLENDMPRDRIVKTQPAALAKKLLS